VKGKTLFRTISLLLLVTIASSAFYVQTADADSTIYIRPDGSVDPSGAPIQRVGSTYIFTANINDRLVIERDNISLDGNNFKLQGAGIGYGVFVNSRNNITIKNIYITRFKYGIYVKLSTNCSIDGNGLVYNELGGVWVEQSSNSNITNNAIVKNYAGVLLTWSNNTNTVASNSLRNNQAGIWLIVSGDNIIRDNTIANSSIGGIYLDRSNRTLIYHNNLIGNIPQAEVPDSTSTWDNGYPSGGNYWSDYTGTDTNSDGIGDTSYVIDASNTDRYPLMQLQGTHDVAVTNITMSKTVIGKGYTANITVSFKNEGDLTQILNTTTFANVTIIRNETFCRRAGQSVLLTIIWNTTTWAKGTYEISASTERIAGETNPQASDNLFIFGLVKVTVPGDVDGDRDIDIYDIVTIASIYGSKLNEPMFKPNADVDSDNRISIYDVVIAASRYGYSE